MDRTQPETIYESFTRTVERASQKTALIYLGSQWSYGKLQDLVEQCAAALHRLGLKKRDRVALCLPNMPQWVIAFLAIQRVGATAVAMDPMCGSSELLETIKHTQPRVLISTDANFGYANLCRSQNPGMRIIVTTITQLLPWWKRVINRLLNLAPVGSYALGEEDLSFTDLLRGKTSSLSSFEGTGEDVAVLLYTSGTTGRPKGVPYTDNASLENMMTVREVSIPEIPLGRGITLQGAPLYESLALMTALACLTRSGETLILAPEENGDAYLSLVEKHKVTHFLGSADLFRGLLGNPRADFYDLSTLSSCFCGGDILPAGTAEGWRVRFDKRIHQCYTLTEGCGAVTIAALEEPTSMGSAGKIAPCKRVKFVIPEAMVEVQRGELGEILISSDHMVRSYWNSPKETTGSFVEMDGGLWFRTGDVGRMAENGCFYFLSRINDIIHHQGHQILATEIERALENHSAVARATVVAIQDPRSGQRIKGYLVLKPGIRGITSYQLLDWCREKLPSHMVPHYIEFRDMLPTSRAGKLLKRMLITEEREAYE